MVMVVPGAAVVPVVSIRDGKRGARRVILRVGLHIHRGRGYVYGSRGIRRAVGLVDILGAARLADEAVVPDVFTDGLRHLGSPRHAASRRAVYHGVAGMVHLIVQRDVETESEALGAGGASKSQTKGSDGKR